MYIFSTYKVSVQLKFDTFLEAYDLPVVLTFFKKEKEHIITYKSRGMIVN